MRFVVAVMVVGSLSCAASTLGWTPLNGPALRVSAPRTIDGTMAVPASFQIRAPGSSGTAGLGSWMDARYLEDDLRDPSRQLGNTLLQVLAKKYALHIQSAQTSDLSLTVSTVAWALECDQTSSSCAVVYRGRILLMDNRSKSVLAAGDCQSAATGQIVLARQSGGLKVAIPRIRESFEDAATECADRFRRELFGFYGS